MTVPGRDDLNLLSDQVLACAFRVHTALGPGLLESVYKACLAIELRDLGLEVSIEHPCPVFYKNEQVTEVGYRMDILVNQVLVIDQVGRRNPSDSSCSVTVLPAPVQQAGRFGSELQHRTFKRWNSKSSQQILELKPLRNLR